MGSGLQSPRNNVPLQTEGFRRAKLNALKRGGYVFSKLDGVEAKEYSKKARR